MGEQEPWVVVEVVGRVVGLAIGLAASIGWEERPVEQERVRVAREEVLVGLGWLVNKKYQKFKEQPTQYSGNWSK